MAVFENREPVTFAAGDTISFQRYLRDFLPSDGWSLHYEVRGENGDAEVAFDSEAANEMHQVDINGFAAGVEPDAYVLVGYAVNGEERHQIYYAELRITPNLGEGEDVDADVTTHAQRMVALLEQQLERLATHELHETDVQRTRIVRAQRKDVLDQLRYYRELRAYELKQLAMRNGLPNPNVIPPVFNVG